MHLAERRGRDRFPLERSNALDSRTPSSSWTMSLDVSEGKRLDVVLEAGERLQIGRRQQIGARREQLAELDEGRPELFQIGGKGARLRSVALDLLAGVEPEPVMNSARAYFANEPREIAVPAEPWLRVPSPRGRATRCDAPSCVILSHNTRLPQRGGESKSVRGTTGRGETPRSNTAATDR
jgi:hypothetical protein